MSELFTELSEQQQELVAGGFSIPGLDLDNYNKTSFTQKYQSAGATGVSQSGRYGSAAGGTVFGVNEKIDTYGKSDLTVNIPSFPH